MYWFRGVQSGQAVRDYPSKPVHLAQEHGAAIKINLG
jgi:hypothetical protein